MNNSDMRHRQDRELYSMLLRHGLEAARENGHDAMTTMPVESPPDAYVCKDCGARLEINMHLHAYSGTAADFTCDEWKAKR